jgi:hypothetical protein
MSSTSSYDYGYITYIWSTSASTTASPEYVYVNTCNVSEFHPTSSIYIIPFRARVRTLEEYGLTINDLKKVKVSTCSAAFSNEIELGGKPLIIPSWLIFHMNEEIEGYVEICNAVISVFVSEDNSTAKRLYIPIELLEFIEYNGSADIPEMILDRTIDPGDVRGVDNTDSDTPITQESVEEDEVSV